MKKTYAFGMYLGKDGKRHMGFDVAVREDEKGQQVFVEKFDPGLGIRCFGFTIWFRKPHKSDHEDSLRSQAWNLLDWRLLAILTVMVITSWVMFRLGWGVLPFCFGRHPRVIG